MSEFNLRNGKEIILNILLLIWFKNKLTDLFLISLKSQDQKIYVRRQTSDFGI